MREARIQTRLISILFGTANSTVWWWEVNHGAPVGWKRPDMQMCELVQ